MTLTQRAVAAAAAALVAAVAPVVSAAPALQARGLAFWGSVGVRPGDVVLYGTGPANPSTSTHIGVVIEVRGSGQLVTVEGNFDGAVTRVGPRYPWEDWGYGPVYGYVRPSG